MKSRKIVAISTHPRPHPLAPKSGATRRGGLFRTESPKSPLEKGDLGGLTFGLLILTLFFLFPSLSKAQETFGQTFTKTVQFSDNEDNKFLVININGAITIEAYNGETVELTVTEHLEGTSSEIERAKRELEFKLERKGDVIIAWLDAPFTELEYEESEYQYDWDHDYEDRGGRDYSFTHTIRIRVPKNIIIEASTINGEAVKISGSFRKVEADNINGDIILKNMTSQTDAETINGDITAKYDEAPDRDSTFDTLNGTIEVFMPEDLSADIYFDSFHGDLFTNFKNLQRLEPEVQKSSDSGHATTTYSIDEFSPVRIGSGEINLRFEVLDGDVYLRKW